jgi:hypothetical protein
MSKTPIDPTDFQRDDFDLVNLWDLLTSPILCYVDDEEWHNGDEEEIEDYQDRPLARHLWDDYWLYVDEKDGYAIVKADVITGHWSYNRSESERYGE